VISLEELKRLHEKATKSGYSITRGMDEYEIRGKGGHYVGSTDRKVNANLMVYLRNHCEEIIKILEERE